MDDGALGGRAAFDEGRRHRCLTDAVDADATSVFRVDGGDLPQSHRAFEAFWFDDLFDARQDPGQFSMAALRRRDSGARLRSNGSSICARISVICPPGSKGAGMSFLQGAWPDKSRARTARTGPSHAAQLRSASSPYSPMLQAARKSDLGCAHERQPPEIGCRSEISDHLLGISMTKCGVPSDVLRGDRPLGPTMPLICRRMFEKLSNCTVSTGSFS
ncbi:hypothetical protein PSAL_018590 [Pseudooceanicola algae]|uniref:Uncharacterized protein n=1 Tax=Pseudooceanicola algae TaxID=1537215 RepID=A0A418SJM2_9RHOB|nr:hypothetical protein PSAL_018590 [Pseudooceanicola algae]